MVEVGVGVGPGLEVGARVVWKDLPPKIQGLKPLTRSALTKPRHGTYAFTPPQAEDGQRVRHVIKLYGPHLTEAVLRIVGDRWGPR